MANKVLSKKFSFDGWKFWTAVKGTVKQVVIIGVPLLVTLWATKSPTWAAFAGVVGKFVISSVEYFYKEY